MYKSLPTEVHGIDFEVKVIAQGYTHACVLAASGNVICWGDNQAGELGRGYTDVHRESPDLPVISLDVDVVDIAVGSWAPVGFSCAITASNEVLCWGAPDHARRVDADPSEYWLTPTPIPGLDNDVVSISFGCWHSCVLTTAGGVKCWGGNEYGQVGDATTEDRAFPTQVKGLQSGVKSISTGCMHTCVVMSSGGAKCWGENRDYQLGDFSEEPFQPVPVNVVGFE